jgi:hypothetical protein
MQIEGLANLGPSKLEHELAQGGRFVFYEYCISLLIFSLRRPSRVYYLRPGQSGLAQGWPYSLISLLLGWWGLPWGFIYTPLALVTNLAGGCDITAQVRAMLAKSPRFAGLPQGGPATQQPSAL